MLAWPESHHGAVAEWGNMVTGTSGAFSPSSGDTPLGLELGLWALARGAHAQASNRADAKQFARMVLKPRSRRTCPPEDSLVWQGWVFAALRFLKQGCGFR